MIQNLCMIINHVIKAKKLFLISLFFLLGSDLVAQNPGNFQKMVDFLPPAPNASAIIKHAAISLNKNTGSPTINIPLFTIKGTKLSVPMSIGYSSTGIKVDEIASRVGMGWALNAGGVVTRTVRGWVDDNNTMLVPPNSMAGGNCGTYAFLENVATSSNTGVYDSEPDLYNFNANGISGSFVFDANGQPVLIPAEKYKIVKDLARPDWNFKITGTDGIIYYFGGTSATEKTKRNSTCGKTYDQYTPNAWYLNKIEHPNGEVINLSYSSFTYSYETGVSETQNWTNFIIDTRDVPAGYYANCPSAPQCTNPASSTCINFVSTQGVLLTSISNSHSSVAFSYNTRLDCGDKLITSVTQSIDGQTSGVFNFIYSEQQSNMSYANPNIIASGYDYTPYLIELKETSPDQVYVKTHKFMYDEAWKRPNRLSFAQDHWGYFNGKTNSTLIPRPKDFYLQLEFPNATADREADPLYAGKGMLKKIIYPTGGIDSIQYESNDEWPSQGLHTYHEYNCNVTGSGNTTQVSKTMTFTIDYPQIVELDITSTTQDPNNYDPIHMQGEVIVSGSGSTPLSEAFPAGSQGIQYVRYLNPSWYLSAGTYTITYSAKGANQTLNIKLKYYPTGFASSSGNKIVGGVRVKRVMTGNPGETPTIKKYYYAEMSDLGHSSLNTTLPPVYNKDYETAIPCQIQLTAGGQNGPVNLYCHHTAMYSGTLTNLFNYGSAPVSYAYVIESNGENFEGGAIQSKFYAGGDALPYTWLNNGVLGAPLSNLSSPLNGKLNEEIVYKKPASGILFPIKKTQYTYILDSRAHTAMFGYTINKRYDIAGVVPGIPCSNSSSPVGAYIMDCYDATRYYIDSWWGHLETQTETLYDENGSNPVVTTTNFYFDNDQHLQLTRTKVTNSKGQEILTTNKYPGDMTGQVYTDMVNLNIITPLINTKTDIVNAPSNIPVSEEQIDYSNTGNNNYVPTSVQKAVKGNSLESEGTIDVYDAKGNILQFTSKAGIVTSVIWGYDYRYPVAQIVGAAYSSAVAQLTGGSVTALQSMDGAALRTEINQIRTNIPSASVTTYTYVPKAGVSSITEPNNRTNSYEYDSFNRLFVILDQDGNVIKKNEYIYATPDTNSVLNVYHSAPVSKTYTCQNCQSGYIANPSSITYVVPYGKYFSLVSQPAADALAAADNDGQEYANKTGKCYSSVTATCTGTGYKVVNCACQLGTKVCDNTVDNGNGTYTVTYRYHWTDNTYSSQITETISCTGVDKKMINCSCETGQKICDNVTNNGGGSYTITYHYLWSDNSTSGPITETISCSGADKKMIGCNCIQGIKVYTSSVYDKWGTLGCSAGQWLCTFHYHWWQDNSNSDPYTECTLYGDCSNN